MEIRLLKIEGSYPAGWACYKFPEPHSCVYHGPRSCEHLISLHSLRSFMCVGQTERRKNWLWYYRQRSCFEITRFNNNVAICHRRVFGLVPLYAKYVLKTNESFKMTVILVSSNIFRVPSIRWHHSSLYQISCSCFNVCGRYRAFVETSTTTKAEERTEWNVKISHKDKLLTFTNII